MHSPSKLVVQPSWELIWGDLVRGSSDQRGSRIGKWRGHHHRWGHYIKKINPRKLKKKKKMKKTNVTGLMEAPETKTSSKWIAQ